MNPSMRISEAASVRETPRSSLPVLPEPVQASICSLMPPGVDRERMTTLRELEQVRLGN